MVDDKPITYVYRGMRADLGDLRVDQKPSWFNNAGHTGTFARKGSQPSVRENFNHTTQRYSILTSVPSWGHANLDAPPKVAILFKAAPT